MYMYIKCMYMCISVSAGDSFYKQYSDLQCGTTILLFIFGMHHDYTKPVDALRTL